MHTHTSIRAVSLAAVLAFATTWVACSGSASSPAPTTASLDSGNSAVDASNLTATDESSGAALPAGRPAGPPDEALTACEQKAESEACSFSNPRGGVVDGTCVARRDVPGQRVCFPNDRPGPDGEGGPPEELIAACEQKVTGDACSFTSPQGDTTSGTCAEGPDGIPGLLCHPEDWTGRRGPRGPHAGDGAPLAACETLTEGAGCSFEAPWGTVTGTCRVGRDGLSLVCAPADWPGPGR